jgi:putative transcriptional regulator
VSRDPKGRVRNKVKALRLAAPLPMTQQDLADRVGATRQTINAIEAEKYAPTLDLAFRIVAVFDARFDDVFWYEP